MPAMSLTSLAILRYLKANGLSTREEIKTGVADFPKNNFANLVAARYIAQDNTTDPARFGITPNGLKKLANPKATPAAFGKTTAAEAAAMLSSEEIESLVLKTIRKAAIHPDLDEVCRRTSLRENLVRPAIIALVQKREIATRQTTPPSYRATAAGNASTRAKATARANNRRGAGYPSGYTCPELARNPGIPAERFAAFDLPRREGKWLFYPDGRKEPFPTREQTAQPEATAESHIHHNPYAAQLQETV